MDRAYVRPRSPPRRTAGHPARNSTGILDLQPAADYYGGYYSPPRTSRESLPSSRSSADKYDRPPAPSHHRDSLPLRRNPEDYNVAPRRPEARRPVIVPPPDANYRPVIQSAIEASPDFRRLRPREEESYYVQPNSTRGNHHHRTHSSSGYGDHTYPVVRPAEGSRDRHGQDRGRSSQVYYQAPAIRPRRDMDDRDYGYEYTDFREQAYRDLAPRARPRRGSESGRRERPVSTSGMEDVVKRAPPARAEGPPVTTRGFNKLDRSAPPAGTVRQYHYPREPGSEEPEPAPRRQSRDGRGSIAVHQDRSDGYSSATDERSHRHRSRRESSAEPSRRPKNEGDAERPRRHHERHLSATEDDYGRHRHRGSRDESHDRRRESLRPEDVEGETKRRQRQSEGDREYRHRDRGGGLAEEKPRRRKHEDGYEKRSDDRYEERGKDKNDHHHLGEAVVGAAAAAATAAGVGALSKHRNEPDDDSSKASERSQARSHRRKHKESNEESDTSTEPGDSEYDRKERRRRRKERDRERTEADTRAKGPSETQISPPGTSRGERTSPPNQTRSEEDSRRQQRRHREESDSGSNTNDPDQKRQLQVVSPSSKQADTRPKGILKQPKEKFPEDPAPVREGVAPLKDAGKKGIPPNARWTKIDRRLVNPEALRIGNERFEERADYVIVLRVLNKEEIEAYAEKTAEIREERRLESQKANMLPLADHENRSGSDADDVTPLAIADRPYYEPEVFPGSFPQDRRGSAPPLAAMATAMPASAPNLQDPVYSGRPDPHQTNSYQRLNPSGQTSMNSSIASAATWPQANGSPQPGPASSGVLYPQVPSAGVSPTSQHYPAPPSGTYAQLNPPPPPPPHSASPQLPPQMYGQGGYAPQPVPPPPGAMPPPQTAEWAAEAR